jgi:hypothetical protein
LVAEICEEAEGQRQEEGGLAPVVMKREGRAVPKATTRKGV